MIAVALLAAAARAADEDPRERQGRALYAKGQYQEALDIYAELFAEKGDPIYMRNIGRCNQKLRRPDKAIDAFRDYLRRAHKLKPAEREEIEGYIKEMQDLKAQMDRQAAEQKAADREAAERAARERAGAPAAQPVTQPATKEDASAGAPAMTPEETGAAPTPPGAPESGPATPREERGPGAFFVALSLGSGFGFATGSGELNSMHTLAAPGFAVAQLGHLAPELGVFATRHLLLSAQLRLQYVAYVSGEYLTDVCGAGAYCESSSLALAAFGRVAWLTGDGAVHFLGGLAVGGGNIRHALEFASDRHCGTTHDTTCVDTLASGPFLFGPSVGLVVDLGRVVGLMAQINTQIGVPKFTLNFDLNVGLTFRP
ncbi:MAG TPA: tetratricopeptide repeat protein [Polyangia bacterium]